LDVILASRILLIGNEDVAGELLLRVDHREEEERGFLLFFYTKRYVGRAGLGCGGVGLVMGCTWWAAAVLLLGSVAD
jgi:hypothetical protein